MLDLVNPANLSTSERQVNSLLLFATLCATIAIGVRSYNTSVLPSQASKRNKKKTRTPKRPKLVIPGFPPGRLFDSFIGGRLKPIFVYEDLGLDMSSATFSGRIRNLVQSGEVYCSEWKSFVPTQRTLVGITDGVVFEKPQPWFSDLLKCGDITLNYDEVFTLPQVGLNSPLISQASVRQFIGFGRDEKTESPAQSRPVMYTDASRTANTHLQVRKATQSSLAGFSMDSIYNDETTRREDMKFITFKTVDAARGALNGPTGQCIGVQDPELEKLAKDFNVMVQTSSFSKQEVTSAQAEELSSDDVGY